MGDQQNLDAVVLEDRKPQPALSTRATVRIDELAEPHSQSLRELWRSMQARGLTAQARGLTAAGVARRQGSGAELSAPKPWLRWGCNYRTGHSIGM